MVAVAPLQVAGVSNHAVEQYRRRILGRDRHSTDDQIRECIIKAIARSKQVEIPARFRIAEILNYDGRVAAHFYDSSRQAMYVVSLDGVVLTCYEMSKSRLVERTPKVTVQMGAPIPPRRARVRQPARMFDHPPDRARDDEDGDESSVPLKSKYRRVRRVEIDDVS